MRRFILALVVWAAATTFVSYAPVSAQPDVADPVSILFIGNSHVRGNDLPDLVMALVAQSGVEVNGEVAPGYQFLDERLSDPASVELLAQGGWTHVILQAQRYSSSGAYDYPTTQAEEWVRLVRDVGAVPILFPEWSRRGIDETGRIVELHESIADAEPACVPPIPQAFDAAAVSGVDVALHADDGNHSSSAGALLAALAIAHTITGQRVGDMTDVDGVAGADPAVQAALRAAAADAVAARSPWRWCPGDRPPGAPGPPCLLATDPTCAATLWRTAPRLATLK